MQTWRVLVHVLMAVYFHGHLNAIVVGQWSSIGGPEAVKESLQRRQDQSHAYVHTTWKGQWSGTSS